MFALPIDDKETALKIIGKEIEEWIAGEYNSPADKLKAAMVLSAHFDFLRIMLGKDTFDELFFFNRIRNAVQKYFDNLESED